MPSARKNLEATKPVLRFEAWSSLMAHQQPVIVHAKVLKRFEINVTSARRRKV
jgi:hypothetical protein